MGAFGVLLATSAACSDPTHEIRYRYPAGQEVAYRFTVEATTSAGSSTGFRTVRLVLDVKESVLEPRPDGGARVKIVLQPVQITENGGPAEPGPPAEVELDVSPTGRVEKVHKAGELTPDALAALELERLLSESRPPLPPMPVRLGDRWPTPLAAKGERSAIDLAGQGRLAGFDLRNGRRLARVVVDRDGTISSNQAVGDEQVPLVGESTMHSVASVDLDRGILVESLSQVESRFQIAGEAGVSTLTVRLTTRITLAE